MPCVGEGQTGFVDATSSSLYKGYRYPVEIISHCVWLYHRFPLSLREVEEMMLARGVLVTYESIHQWCRKFGQAFANGLRRRRPRPGRERNKSWEAVLSWDVSVGGRGPWRAGQSGGGSATYRRRGVRVVVGEVAVNRSLVAPVRMA